MINSPVEQDYTSRFMPLLEQSGIELDQEKVAKLLSYHRLLVKWNRAYNLTAVRDPDEMLSRHLMDSLVVAPFVSAKEVLDVGSGGGLPGIPLAIMYPEKRWVLLDSNGKKTRFLTQCKIELGLNNIEVVNTRVESYRPPGKFSEIISRAFASLDDMIHWCQHLLDENGRFLAMKGAAADQELSEMKTDWLAEKCLELVVPGCAAERHLIIIRRSVTDLR